MFRSFNDPSAIFGTDERRVQTRLSRDDSMNPEPLLIFCPSEGVGLRIQQTLAPQHQSLLTTDPESLFALLAERSFCGIVFDHRDASSGPVERGCRFELPEVLHFLHSKDLSVQVYDLCDLDQAGHTQLESVCQVHSIIQLAAELRRSRDAHSSLALFEQQAERKLPSETCHRVSDHDRDFNALFDLETRSPRFREMLTDLFIAGGHDVAILLVGETGSGKTHLSKMIHANSPRSQQPFIHVACGALPRDLLESELFGHVKGAFTSAHVDKAGKFVAAQGGTILLDEIDVLGPEQQVKLLRVIETGEFEPVGSNHTLKSQARLVFASNLDLESLVEQGRIRPDLYYRLNMLKFEIPPLRQRRMDIAPLCEVFVGKYQQKHKKRVLQIEQAVIDALHSYPWPGNVRELEHVMQRAVIYCRDGIIRLEHLPQHLISGQVGPVNDPSIRLGRTTYFNAKQSLGRQVAVSEKEIIEQTLSENNFSRTNTAKQLGISRVTLYNKMKKYNMLKTL